MAPKGADAGDADGSGQGDTELRIEDAGRAGHEADGDEHSHEDKCTGDDGHRHVAHGVLRGFVWACVARIELGLHGFHYDDGIIYHRSDGKHQGEECQQVERKARQCHACKGADKRHDDGDGRDDGCAEVLQEEIDHEDDEDDGYDECLFHVSDRGQQEVVARHHVDELESFGQVFREVVQQVRDAVVCLFGVSTSQLEAKELNAGLAIRLAVEGVADGSQLHRSDVLQSQHGAVVVGTDDNVLKLCDFFQTSLVLQGILIDVLHACSVVAVDGLFAELSGRGFEVLFCQGSCDVLGHDAILSHDVGLHPDAERIGAAKQHDVAHAFQSLQLRDDVDVEIVGDEVLVVLSVDAGEGINLQEGGLSLLSLHAHPCDVGRQQTLCFRDAVLHVHGSHIGVGALLEEDVDGGGTRIGGRGGHVEHVFHAVDTFFQGLDDRVHHGIGTCTRIGGIDADGWRSDVGIRLQRQGEVADSAYEDNHDGDGDSHHRALYEYITFHIKIEKLKS